MQTRSSSRWNAIITVLHVLCRLVICICTCMHTLHYRRIQNALLLSDMFYFWLYHVIPQVTCIWHCRTTYFIVLHHRREWSLLDNSTMPSAGFKFAYFDFSNCYVFSWADGLNPPAGVCIILPPFVSPKVTWSLNTLVRTSRFPFEKGVARIWFRWPVKL